MNCSENNTKIVFPFFQCFFFFSIVVCAELFHSLLKNVLMNISRSSRTIIIYFSSFQICFFLCVFIFASFISISIHNKNFIFIISGGWLNGEWFRLILFFCLDFWSILLDRNQYPARNIDNSIRIVYSSKMDFLNKSSSLKTLYVLISIIQ